MEITEEDMDIGRETLVSFPSSEPTQEKRDADQNQWTSGRNFEHKEAAVLFVPTGHSPL
jgi:hypothetical protein